MNVIKKILFIALMIWLLCYVSSYATTATINTEAVRIRREASTDSEVIIIAYNNEEVTLIEQQGDWYKIKYKEYIGFIRSDLLNLVEEQPNIPSEPTTEEVNQEPNVQQENSQETEILKENTKKVVTVNTSLRMIPSITASKINEIIAGTVVKVIQVKNNWTCIEFNGKSAWLPNVVLSDTTEAQPNLQDQEKPVEIIKIMYINVNSANIRTEPTTSSEIVTTMTKNKTVEILEDMGDWYKIKLDNHIGYISKPLVSEQMDTTTSRNIEEPREQNSVQETIEQPVEEAIIRSVYVNVEKANLRSSSSTASSIVTYANRKDKLDVLAEENGWYKLKLSNGNAYIRKDLVVNNIEEVVIPVVPVITTNPTTSVGNSSTPTGQAVVEYAKQFLGCRYSYGGAGPTSFDCSGFTQYVYKKFGIYLSHSAVTQANNGVYIEKTNLQLGDLIIFRDWDNSSIGHCGIYVGNSKFIHAANPSRGVVTDTFASGYYYERYVSARRLF